MLTITKEFQASESYPMEQIGPKESLLFFDIETTGFSGTRASLYLIGCVYYQNGSFWMKQWFADDKNSEKEMLKEFFSFLSRFKVLVHFNGDTFDIPFVLRRCERYKLRYDFNEVISFDIYKKIKPLKKLLHLENLKQKTIETFLGIGRKDLFNGGQLIPVYEEFIATKDERLKLFLLLHNEEDLKGMPHILSILAYTDFINGSFAYHSHELLKETTPLLKLKATGPITVPIPFSVQRDNFSLDIHGNHLTFFIPLYVGECKLFYPNYKDYYYLPLEDNAMHKSIAEYVDKEHRIKATAKTCYTRKNGTYLYQAAPSYAPALKKDYHEKCYYTPYHNKLFDDSTAFQDYIRQLLGNL